MPRGSEPVDPAAIYVAARSPQLVLVLVGFATQPPPVEGSDHPRSAPHTSVSPCCDENASSRNLSCTS